MSNFIQGFVVGLMIAMLSFLFMTHPAYAQKSSQHGHEDFWINQEKYKAPEAAGVLKGVHCCGEKDCTTMKRGVDFELDTDENFWVFLKGPKHQFFLDTFNIKIEGKKWPRANTQSYQSEDASNWLCAGPNGIYCFFVAEDFF